MILDLGQRSGQTDGWLPTAAVTQNAADDVRSGGGSADRVAAREGVALQKCVYLNSF